MADMTGMMIRVKTEELVATAGQVESQIDRMEQAFRDVESIVNNTAVYWQGEGNNAHIQAYRNKMETIQTALKRFRENAADLQSIAGVYDAGEKNVNEIAMELPGDVII